MIVTITIMYFFSAPAELNIKFAAVSKTVEVHKQVNFNLSQKEVFHFLRLNEVNCLLITLITVN